MTDIDPKALEHACQCAGRSVHHFDRMGDDLPLRASIIAHARAIEQHEAFRQEVSDALEKRGFYIDDRDLGRFIITKPDPLVEAVKDILDDDSLHNAEEFSEAIRAALAKRGLEIREKE